jgi:hypothetical protein
MRSKRLFHFTICFLLFFQSCTPVGEQFIQLADDVIGEGSNNNESQIYNPVNGFGIGSSTNWRVANLDAAYAEMQAMGVRYVREEFPLKSIMPKNMERKIT